MSRKREILNTGDLRRVLSETIDGVLAGSVELASARVVVQAAAQMNVSVMADLQAARLGIRHVGVEPLQIGRAK